MFKGLFRISFLFILFLYLLSFFSYFFSSFNALAFFVIIFFALILSWQKFEYGLLVLLAELFIGAKGHLFFVEMSGFRISLRMALFAIVLSAWAFSILRRGLMRIKRINAEKAEKSEGGCDEEHLRAPLVKIFNRIKEWRGEAGESRGVQPSNNNKPILRDGSSRSLPNARCSFRAIYILLFLAIAWGIVNGLLSGNSLANIFHDANAWLFFALIFVFWSIKITPEFFKNILQVFSAAVLAIIIKSFVLLYIFSHQIEWLMFPVYRWLRLFLLGEITVLPESWPRIFSQSQIYILIGFFVFLGLLILREKCDANIRMHTNDTNKANECRLRAAYFILASLAFSVILMSFSRSFWIGLTVGLVVALVAGFIFTKKGFFTLRWLGYVASIAIFSLGLVWLTINFPFPQPAKIALWSSFGERLTDVSEAAVRSRWDLLPPLSRAIIRRPFFGSGFGATVTFESSDPRALELNPSGKFTPPPIQTSPPADTYPSMVGGFTTYAFEWGYLDIWLKIGLVGLILYLLLLAKIFRSGWRLIKNIKISSRSPASLREVSQREKGRQEYKNNLPTIFGLLIGLVVLMVVHFFSPYLNHPLGIGYVILVGWIFSSQAPSST